MTNSPTRDTSPNTQEADIQTLASQCVKCGLCLPHCPTYFLSEDENESPRGRIELLQAITQHQLPLTEQVQSHLDHCLSCRACERVCPAKVEYGTLITKGRTWIQDQQAKSAKASFKFSPFKLITNKHALKMLHWFVWLSEVTKIRKISDKLGIPKYLGLQTYNQILPVVRQPQSFKTFYPAKGKKVGTVGLFLGCIQKMANPEVYQASINVLTTFGYDVHIPKQQTCCGAIDLHSGQQTRAVQYAKANVQAFVADVDHIVTVASGCGTTLSGYTKYFSEPQLNITQSGNIESFASKVVDISSLIQNSTWPLNLKIKKFSERIAVHVPCTMKNVWRTENAVFEMAKRLSENEIFTIKTQYCCGAAGRYMFDFPILAEQLASNILNELETLPVQILLTSNIGCALHLQRHIRAKNLNISLLHPIIALEKAIIF